MNKRFKMSISILLILLSIFLCLPMEHLVKASDLSLDNYVHMVLDFSIYIVMSRSFHKSIV